MADVRGYRLQIELAQGPHKLAVKNHATHYTVFLKLARMAAIFWPSSIAYGMASWIGRKFSPYLLDKERICASIERGLSAGSGEVERVWLDYLSQHGVFAANLFIHPKMTSAWVASNVTIRGVDVLESLLAAEAGALLLTYHNPHKNTLGAVMGLLGCDVCGVAADPKTFPLYTHLAHYLDMLHDATAKHFGKGGYVFLGPGVGTVRSILRAFRAGHVVISLNDNPNPSQRSYDVDFLGRVVPAPVGAVELAVKENAPVYCAILFWEQTGQFVLEIAQLKLEQGVEGIMKQYFAFLERIINSHPHVWEGWQWFDLLGAKQLAGDEAGEQNSQ